MNVTANASPDKTIRNDPAPTDEQAHFLDTLAATMDSMEVGEPLADAPRLRLRGGPGSGKSFTISAAAHAAASYGWTVFLIGPTHQATGVLAAAVPAAYPFEPTPDTLIANGEIMYCTAHKLSQWVQKSRSQGAAQGEEDPVPRDSWLGRSFRQSWDSPPVGILVFADETSMYTGQMTAAVSATVATLHRLGCGAILVAVGDPDQLTPVRGPNYSYLSGEGSETPSDYAIGDGFKDFALTVNVRAKSQVLRDVVEAYLHHHVVIPPPEGQTIYRWTEANDAFFGQWSERVRMLGEASCIMLGYRRATVAAANDRLCRMLHGTPSHALVADRIMRCQETYSPTGSTLAASSDLVRVTAVRDMGVEIMHRLLPPGNDRSPSRDPMVLSTLQSLIETDVALHGHYPVVDLQVLGVRSGVLTGVPCVVATEHQSSTPTADRWAHMESAITQAAFRRNHSNPIVRRGLASIYYHFVDAAKIRLEAPYAMTSHRAQGSTYKNVAVLAGGTTGGRIVDHRIASARDSSAYVMLSRPSEHLTVAWTPALVPGSLFSF